MQPRKLYCRVRKGAIVPSNSVQDPSSKIFASPTNSSSVALA